ncbi:MAG TPA: hypothetical protein VGL23_15005 [Chloroflexota bacterium]|jgi:hypothetical protein
MAKQTKTTRKLARRANGGRAAKPGLSQGELQAQQGSELPERDAMSLANINVALPINAAAALNVLSDGSVAGAIADQSDPIDQAAP